MTSSSAHHGAAPLGSVRLLSALPSSDSRRSRRRGPRSQISNLRRSIPRHRRTLPDTRLGESRPAVSDSFSFEQSQRNTVRNNIDSACLSVGSAPAFPKGVCIYFVNIRCLLKAENFAELCLQLEVHKPHVVCIQETWLNESTQEVNIPGYETCSRRDRHAGDNRGGILTLQRANFNALVHISNSVAEERSWHFLKLGVDTILLANWYRPGASVWDGFTDLYSELGEYFSQVSGVAIVGDLNIYHKKWLRFSPSDTRIGAEMKALCDFHGLFQVVRQPTHDDYLLDLAITDVVGSTAEVLPRIADHNAVKLNLSLPEVTDVAVPRTVWMLREAHWKNLEEELNAVDWSQLKRGTAEDSVNFFLEVLWTLLVKHIPRKAINCKRSSHPWLNSRCRAAIIRKNKAEYTDIFPIVQQECADILREERAKYVDKLKAKLASLSRRSKQWWRLNRELLRRQATVKSIPPLRDGSTWLVDAKAKADAFAATFSSKGELPAELVDTPFFGMPDAELDDFIPLRTRVTKRLFKKLDESKATGNDQISATILKRLGECLAAPFTQVCRRLLYEGCWPNVWKLHLIAPIFKKGSAYKAGNYRGVHLTSILSKIAEKIIGCRLVPFLQANAFGDNQWAFSHGLGAKDLVTMLVMSWVLAICSGKKIGAYLSDITGAFDRVFTPYLLAKLQSAGVGSTYLNFLSSYLAPRKGKVVVQGSASAEFTLEDTVFQGTVLGPPLWNSYFADVAAPASATGGKEAVFADDLNVFHEFPRHASSVDIMTELSDCRTRVHKWGGVNRVSFDETKEHLVVIHPSQSHGEAFKLLGLMIDLDLRMHTAIEQLLSKIRAKSTAILRTRAYYSTPELVNQYKTHIWGLVEVHCGGYFHAAPSLLDKIDQVQSIFLHKLGVSEKDAFLDHNFAPSSLRRNIAILGLLQKRVLGLCHRSFDSLLPWYSQRFETARGFGHNKQLYGHWVEADQHSALFSRSIFLMVDIYNNLPQYVVDASTVSSFQSFLTEMARKRCQLGNASWAKSFSRLNGLHFE